MKEENTEVLVVGAGPVGLLAANLLADDGVPVRIIDREEGIATQSYACALHPRTLKLLARLGLAPALLKLGRVVPTIAFYEGQLRGAEIKLSELGGEFPFLLIVPQCDLEEALALRLKQKSGLEVQWNQRCGGVQSNGGSVVATVEKLGGTATGYIVPHWESVVVKRFPVHARFLVGADGHNSLIRNHLGIEYERTGKAETFAAIEFEPDAIPANELRIVLDGATANALWPLPEGRCRWTFQLPHSEPSDDFPKKDRSRIHSDEVNRDQDLRHWAQEICAVRAPWFSGSFKEIAWSTQVTFEHRLASVMGRDGCWLAGDAAHQTGPIGVQSMNAGLLEAETLATSLRRILREGDPLELLVTYDRDCRREWRRLLGLEGGLMPCSDTDGWVRAKLDQILPCLPSSGDDLSALASQLRLNLA